MVLLQRRRRWGFTLIEMLVVIAIFGILTGLMMPAIQQVREAGHRTSCQSKLRQVVLACHAHQDQTGVFPPLSGWVGTPNQGGAGYGTVFYMLLPFLEQGPLYDTGLITTGGGQSYFNGTTGAGSHKVPIYMCPSDPTLPKDGTITVNGGTWGVSTYAANAQVFCNVGADGSIVQGVDNALGTQTPNSDVIAYPKNPDSFSDGGAQTIVFSERYGQCGSFGNLWGYTFDNTGWCPYFAGRHNTGGNNIGYVMPPNYMFMGLGGANPWCNYQRGTARIDCNPGQPNSPHPSGITAGLADGSARTCGRNMSAATWFAACTPQGQDIVGNDW